MVIRATSSSVIFGALALAYFQRHEFSWKRDPSRCCRASTSEIPHSLERGPDNGQKASLFPWTSGTPGESGWFERINGGSTANLSNGANQDSFSQALFPEFLSANRTTPRAL
jgi:hypothetical protein